MKRTQLVLVLIFTIATMVSASIAVQGDLFVKTTALPGESYTGTVQIANQGTRNERVQISQADYLYDDAGNNYFNPPGTDVRSNAPWIRFEKDVVVVPPEKSVKVPYTVRVPADSSRTGIYWSIVFIEAITDSLLNPELKEDEVAALSINYRYGVQIATQIGETGTPALTFRDIHIDKEQEVKTITFSIENTGQTLATGDLYALVYSKTGAFLGRFEGRRVSTLPGTSIRRSISFPDLESGSYRIQLLADIGQDKIFGVLVSPTF